MTCESCKYFRACEHFGKLVQVRVRDENPDFKGYLYSYECLDDYADEECEMFTKEPETWYGYDFESLAVALHWLKENEISPDEIKKAVDFYEKGYIKAAQEFEQELKRQVNGIIKSLGGDDE